MVLKQLKKIKYYNDFIRYLQNLNDVNQRCDGNSNIMYLTDAGESNIRYLLTSFRNNIVNTHFFLQEGDEVCGLFKFLPFENELKRVTPTDYREIIFLHNDVWLLINKDFSYSLMVNEKIVLSNIRDHTLYRLGDKVVIAVLEDDENTYLICTCSSSIHNDVFIPSDEMSFQDWYLDTLYRLGQTGMFDRYTISSIIRMEFQIRFNVFKPSGKRFKVLDLKGE